jgi:hypothetical protein
MAQKVKAAASRSTSNAPWCMVVLVVACVAMVVLVLACVHTTMASLRRPVSRRSSICRHSPCTCRCTALAVLAGLRNRVLRLCLSVGLYKQSTSALLVHWTIYYKSQGSLLPPQSCPRQEQATASIVILSQEHTTHPPPPPSPGNAVASPPRNFHPYHPHRTCHPTLIGKSPFPRRKTLDSAIPSPAKNLPPHPHRKIAITSPEDSLLGWHVTEERTPGPRSRSRSLSRRRVLPGYGRSGRSRWRRRGGWHGLPWRGFASLPHCCAKHSHVPRVWGRGQRLRHRVRASRTRRGQRLRHRVRARRTRRGQRLQHRVRAPRTRRGQRLRHPVPTPLTPRLAHTPAAPPPRPLPCACRRRWVPRTPGLAPKPGSPHPLQIARTLCQTPRKPPPTYVRMNRTIPPFWDNNILFFFQIHSTILFIPNFYSFPIISFLISLIDFNEAIRFLYINF